MWTILSLLFLLIAAWIFIQSSAGQNWIVRKVTARLSRDLHTRVEIKKVDVGLFNRMYLQGVIVEDRQKDTLLYAGAVSVRITDWFFLKDKVELKYIGLHDAVIKLQRSDSVWRHQFLIDYFSSPASANTQKKGGTRLNLKKVEMTNVVFLKKDEWLGQDMRIALGSLNLDARQIDFSSRQVDLQWLRINEPDVSIYEYTKKKPSAPQTTSSDEAPVVADSSLQWNAGGWVIKTDELELLNARFRTDRAGTGPAYSWFDGRHIDFSNIHTTLRQVRWEKDTITADLSLQTRERSGFEVKSMKAKVKVTPREMAFNQLDIRTNNSTIRHYFRMSYDDFSSMNDFIHEVQMQGNFADSEIDSDDIAFFAPALSDWNKKIVLKGMVRGTVDDLVGRGLEIQAGENTFLNGDISLTGLPDINQTFIDFKANEFRTTFSSAATIVPAIRHIKSPDLSRLQYLRFNGSFTGFIRDFVTYGTIQTNLGVVKSDLNMKLPEGLDPVYSGTISSDYFRLGDFIGDDRIGAVSLNGTVKGKGFNEKSRNTEVDGTIHFADYNGYRYQNLRVNGRLDKKRFQGLASMNDSEAAFTLNGIIDFNDTIPTFNFVADVAKANLQKLNLTRDDISFAGKFNLDFTGATIDDFLGTAQINDATLTHNGHPLPFDSLLVSAEYSNQTKTIRAKSNEFNARVSGQFNIRDLPDAVKLFLNRYYPSYIKPPVSMPDNEAFTFDITTQYVDEYMQLIDSSLSGFNNSHVFGSLNTRTNAMNLVADVPQFGYKQYRFNDVKLNARGDRDSLSLLGSASNILISDSLNMPSALFSINARHDTSKVKIYTGANQAINQANINAQVLTYDNGVRIEFNPSNFSINGKAWTIEENGELEFRSNMPASGALVLKESNQEIRIRTRPAEIGDWNDLLVELNKVNLGDFSPFFMPKNRLEGLVSGNVLIEDPTNNLYVTADSIKAEGLRLDNDSIGNATVQATYDNKNKQLKATGRTLDPDRNLAFDVNIYPGNPELSKSNLIRLTAKSYQLSILERFLGNLFTDISGYVTGNFELAGELDELQITGRGRLQDAGLKVIFTQCYYKIRDTELELKPTEIDLNGIVLEDPVTHNPVYLSGNIEHTAFRNMFFDLTVSTLQPNTTGANNNRPVLLLNTTLLDNKQFYGRVKGTGSFSLTGPQSDLYMKIDAIASATDSSFVTIPSSQSRESGIADFLVERTYGREMVDSSFASASSNVIYDVDLTANPMVTVKVELDELTGDKIEGRGAGTLNIRSGTNEKMSMRGRFDIEEGNYLFTFQSFFKKPFEISKGSQNYITWNGDPYAARIQFEAKYTAENVSFAPLADILSSTDASYSRLREDVYVMVNLSGDLFKPDFKFRIDLPPNSKANNDFSIGSALQQIEKNQNEINRQVTYLIVFNSFAPPDYAPNTGLNTALSEFTNNTISSISGLFFNEINRKLNSELSRILKTDNISINFSGAVYNRNLLNAASTTGFGINQSNFNVNVPISMFKDRFVVTLGSTLDVPLQSTIQQNVQFLPDVTAEWLINQSGTIRASFFYRQNLDYLTSNTSGAARTKRSGASIAYRKEFDTLKEFFKSKKKKKK